MMYGNRDIDTLHDTDEFKSWYRKPVISQPTTGSVEYRMLCWISSFDKYLSNADVCFQRFLDRTTDPDLITIKVGLESADDLFYLFSRIWDKYSSVDLSKTYNLEKLTIRAG